MEKKKEFSKFFIASLKRTAQNVNPLVRRKSKLLAQIGEMREELASIQAQIDGYQIPIKEATGGWTTEDLVERVVTETTKLDKDGKPIKMTQYVLKYPDTIIPPTEIHSESDAVVVDDNDNIVDEGPKFDGAGFTIEDRNIEDKRSDAGERVWNENESTTVADSAPQGEIIID